jgi:hypothetical protein
MGFSSGREMQVTNGDTTVRYIPVPAHIDAGKIRNFRAIYDHAVSTSCTLTLKAGSTTLSVITFASVAAGGVVEGVAAAGIRTAIVSGTNELSVTPSDHGKTADITVTVEWDQHNTN